MGMQVKKLPGLEKGVQIVPGNVFQYASLQDAFGDRYICTCTSNACVVLWLGLHASHGTRLLIRRVPLL